MTDADSDYYIPDGNIKASSEYSSSFRASHSRLNGSSCWYPASTDKQRWIQADLGCTVSVFGIQTQGSGDWNDGSWVATLKVSTFDHEPRTGDSGVFIKDENQDKVCILKSQSS